MKPTVCLTMIVKNEASTIARAINSVRSIINSYCILIDKSTTDNTAEIIQKELGAIPGKVMFVDWIDFGANRTLAIEAANGCSDYILMLDADDTIEIPTDFEWPDCRDAYEVEMDLNGLIYHRLNLFRNDGTFRYVGAVHEVLTRNTPYSTSRINLRCVPHSDGASWRQGTKAKYLAHAKLLKTALRKNPKDTRSAFYLAQSLKDAGQIAQAISAYQRRAAMDSIYVEETWLALESAAELIESRGYAPPHVIDAYMKAFVARPQRIEPLFFLSRYLRVTCNQPQLAYVYAAAATNGYDAITGVPVPPHDKLWMNHSIYDWRIHDELACGLYWIGRYSESIAVCDRLLLNPNLPQDQRNHVNDNIQYAKRALNP